MPASYPSSVVTLASHADNTDTIFAADINTPNAEIVALETGLLNGLQHDLTPLNNTGKSLGSTSKRWLKIWTQDFDVSGTLTLATGVPVASGGTGAVTLAAHGPLIGNGTTAITVGSPGTAGQIWTSNGASADPTFQNAGGMVLLKANNGTDTSAGATTVDSIALTGLTANDRLKVFYYLTSATANTAQVLLYSVTDSATVVAVSPSPLSAGDPSSVAGEILIGQRQGNANQVYGLTQGMVATPARNDFFLFTTPATAWTGSWTLGLRHGGVTATGTLKWSWAVYRVAGQ